MYSHSTEDGLWTTNSIEISALCSVLLSFQAVEVAQEEADEVAAEVEAEQEAAAAENIAGAAEEEPPADGAGGPEDASDAGAGNEAVDAEAEVAADMELQACEEPDTDAEAEVCVELAAEEEEAPAEDAGEPEDGDAPAQEVSHGFMSETVKTRGAAAVNLHPLHSCLPTKINQIQESVERER